MKRARKQQQEDDNTSKPKTRMEDYFGTPKTVERDITKPLVWQRIKSENLDCDMTMLFSKAEADALFCEMEKTVEYNTGKLAKVQMYGRWMEIPRKQTAFGDRGLTYTFSGNTIPAKGWPQMLLRVKDKVEAALSRKWKFNFVLVNRYSDGNQHIGEHRDDEMDLDRMAPIASVSLGQERDFVFRHKDARGKRKRRPDIQTVTVALKSGSLLTMNSPTNDYWYHSLPVRKRALLPRINLTFRVMGTATTSADENRKGPPLKFENRSCVAPGPDVTIEP